MRPVRTAAVLAAVALGALLVPATPVQAGVPLLYEVTTTADVVDGGDGLLSLREAISQANADAPNDAYVELATGATYHLTICDSSAPDENGNLSGDLDHTDPEELDISGIGATIMQDCSGERVLQKTSATGKLQISRATITGGSSSIDGGGVWGAGEVRLQEAIVRGNTAAGSGGGVYAGNYIYAVGATIEDNRSEGQGAGAATAGDVVSELSTWSGNIAENDGGAIHADDQAQAIRSTLTRNRSDDEGGAIDAGGEVLVSSSTIVANRANLGANISTQGDLIRRYSVIALGSDGADCFVAGTVTSQGYDVGQDGSCGPAGTGDLGQVHPMLAPPALNDYIVASMRPVVGSPVLDLDPAPCGATEIAQNGVGVPQGPGCETGSFEGSPLPCTPPAFNDVGTGHPFFADICWLSAMGVAGGFPNGSYKPTQVVTRQAMSAFIFRLAGSPLFPEPETPTFTDVDDTNAFETEIEWMAAEDITGGFPDDTFRPGDPVKRQAMASFLYHVAGDPVFVPGPPTFEDVPADHPFFPEIEWLADTGVTEGYDDDTFRPADPVKRQAMAAFLQRLAADVEMAGL